LLFIEPTRIDVGAKAEIYRYLDNLAKEGAYPGRLARPDRDPGVADRILVMHEGVIAEYRHIEATDGFWPISRVRRSITRRKAQKAMAVTQQKEQAYQGIRLTEQLGAWLDGLASCW
jgi:hypothetical protein